MTDYDIYNLFLCIIVFVILIALSAVCLTCITRLNVKLINCGGSDEQIKKEYKKITKSSKGFGDKFFYVLSIIICAVFIITALFSICLNFVKKSVSDVVPTFRVVQSQSMSEKLESNDYLYTNDLNDQFDMFDVVLTYKMPDEYELEVYDIVVYEIDDELVIHRIIAIEEPNENHPDCRYFTLRGDNVAYSDSSKVTYDQMMGIYRGERIRYLGSFVMFLQSPAGWLCLLVLVAAVIVAPLLENYVGKQKYRRFRLLFGQDVARALPNKPIEIPNDLVKKPDEKADKNDTNFDIDGFYDVFEDKPKKKRRVKKFKHRGEGNLNNKRADGKDD